MILLRPAFTAVATRPLTPSPISLPRSLRAERDGALRERIRYYCRFALLIVDEIGYLPVNRGEDNLSFQLVSAR